MSSESIPHSRIYTKTGDSGSASLYNLERAPKTSSYFEALGAVDELTSNLGMAVAHCGNDERVVEVREEILRMMDDCMAVASHIATPLTSEMTSADRAAAVSVDVARIGRIEAAIDRFDERLPKLTAFILPTGTVLTSQLHISRTVCRRAERRAVELYERRDVSADCVRYLNRLSDALFVMARMSQALSGGEETKWKLAMRSTE